MSCLVKTFSYIEKHLIELSLVDCGAILQHAGNGVNDSDITGYRAGQQLAHARRRGFSHSANTIQIPPFRRELKVVDLLQLREARYRQLLRRFDIFAGREAESMHYRSRVSNWLGSSPGVINLPVLVNAQHVRRSRPSVVNAPLS